jgi:hypothetical protein
MQLVPRTTPETLSYAKRKGAPRRGALLTVGREETGAPAGWQKPHVRVGRRAGTQKNAEPVGQAPREDWVES